MRISGTRATDLAHTIAVLLAISLAGLLASGCEKPTHDNLDKWMRTQKGPGKLREALRNSELDPDLRAHAARNLIRMDESLEVLDTLQAMNEGRRAQVVDKLATRLWEDARITGDQNVAPGADQVGAKDALFAIRDLGEPETRARIDGYLVDWLTRGYYYEQLAEVGRHSGAVILAAIGPGAGPSVVRSANALLGARDPEGNRYQVGDNLLLGLSVTAHPEAVALVLDLVEGSREEPNLPERAMAALYDAYVQPTPPRDRADPQGVAPHLDRLVRLLKDERQPVTLVNGAIGLIGAVGMPACLPPLVEMVSYPHSHEDYRWVGLDNALHCGKVEAIVPVAEALPRADYEGTFLRGMVWGRMKDSGAPGEVAARARTLLESDSWLARLTGVELLGMLGLRDTAQADAERLRKLERDKTVLKGWWGDQSELPKAQRKPVPTLGQRAAEVAKALQALPTEAQKQ